MCSLVQAIQKEYSSQVRKFKPFIYVDDCATQFILTRRIEIYLYDKKVLGILIYRNSKEMYKRLLGMVDLVTEDDDGIIECRGDIKNLFEIMKVGGLWKKRPYLSGKFIENASEKLGHKIKPFRLRSDNYGEQTYIIL